MASLENFGKAHMDMRQNLKSEVETYLKDNDLPNLIQKIKGVAEQQRNLGISPVMCVLAVTDELNRRENPDSLFKRLVVYARRKKIVPRAPFENGSRIQAISCLWQLLESDLSGVSK